jgi:hypothetical protein
MNYAVKPVVFLALLALSGCISGLPEDTTYTDHSGKTTLIESDQEMCTRSCNEDYSRCMDTQPAEQTTPGMPSGMFGASGECRSELSKCLPRCKSQ